MVEELIMHLYKKLEDIETDIQSIKELEDDMGSIKSQLDDIEILLKEAAEQNKKEPT